MITSAQQEFHDYAEPPADDYCPVAEADKIMSDFMEFGAAEHGEDAITIESLLEDESVYDALMDVICKPTAENANKLSSAVLQLVERWADEQTSHKKTPICGGQKTFSRPSSSATRGHFFEYRQTPARSLLRGNGGTY